MTGIRKLHMHCKRIERAWRTTTHVRRQYPAMHIRIGSDRFGNPVVTTRDEQGRPIVFSLAVPTTAPQRDEAVRHAMQRLAAWLLVLHAWLDRHYRLHGAGAPVVALIERIAVTEWRSAYRVYGLCRRERRRVCETVIRAWCLSEARRLAKFLTGTWCPYHVARRPHRLCHRAVPVSAP